MRLLPRTRRVIALLSATLALVLLAGCSGAPQPPTAAGQHDDPVPPYVLARPPLAEPVTVDVKRIGIVGAMLIPLGLRPDGTVDTPPAAQPLQGGYWRASAPTATTPTVILGRVSGGGQPGLFAHLGEVTEGDTVTVHRSDGTVSRYTILHTERVDAERFPTDWVYSDQAMPTLRLVTVGDGVKTARRGALDNVVAFGALTT
jgi:hypothetical protein